MSRSVRGVGLKSSGFSQSLAIRGMGTIAGASSAYPVMSSGFEIPTKTGSREPMNCASFSYLGGDQAESATRSYRSRSGVRRATSARAGQGISLPAKSTPFSPPGPAGLSNRTDRTAAPCAGSVPRT